MTLPSAIVTPGGSEATGPPTTVSPAGHATEDVEMDEQQSADQIRLTTLLRQQKDATTRKQEATRKVLDAAPGPEQGAAKKELKAVSLELANIKRKITLLQESVAEMGELSSLDAVSIMPAAPAVALAAVDDSSLAKIRPLKVPTNAPRFRSGTQARLFLDDLQSKVSAFIGQDAFDDEYTLAAITKDPALTRWEWCEAVFVRHALSEHERMMELNKLLAGGLLPMETYQQFAIRVARDTRIYGVKDDNEIVLASLCNSLPAETLNLILFSHRISLRDLDAKLTSVIAFTEYMKRLVGPRPPQSAGATSNHQGPSSRASSSVDRPRNRHSTRFDPRARRDLSRPDRADAHLEHRHTTVDRPYECAQCGPNSNHTTAHCKRCSNCHKVGHSAAVCRSPSAIAPHGAEFNSGLTPSRR
ncbi:hypothetical protein BG005_001194 [Podila minutissima]|nr:hypothetical protein BG005_001194 [Podila minutissima]